MGSQPAGWREHPGLSPVDAGAKPCTDFYQYACSRWLADNPLPADRSRWMAFNPVGDRTQAVLRDIVENAAAGGPTRSPLEQKIGDAYASCMDASAIEAKGLEPLKPDLDRIASLQDKTGLPALVGYLHGRGVAGLLFGFGATQDAKNATMMIAVDTHSPGRFRVNGVVSNLQEFRQAFGCTAGDPIVREQVCRVW